jgi:SAM-dependent methyltransferase
MTAGVTASADATSLAPCAGCGRRDGGRIVHELWSTEPREPYSILACATCGLLRTVPVPLDLGRYYRAEPGRWMRERTSPLFAALQSIQLRREARRVERLGSGQTVIDVGAGSGRFARVLQRRGHRVFTADAGSDGPPETAGCPDVAHLVVDFDSGRVEGLPAGSYTVVLRHVLEHARDPRRLLAGLLRQGAGAFYVVVPNAACVERRLLGKIWFLWDPPRHLWHFDGGSLAVVCRNAGLEVVRSGHDTIANVGPSLYRALELRGWSRVARPFAPRGALNALSAPLNLLLPGNVVWVLARRGEGTVAATHLT